MPTGPGFLPAAARFLNPLLDQVLCLPTLNTWNEGAEAADPERHFAYRVLDEMGVPVVVSRGSLDLIPKEGPVVVVANHPLGGVEGVGMLALLSRVRDDVKVLANYFLSAIRCFRPDFFFVDPFDTPESVRKNVAAMRGALKWAHRHLLGVFPAGEVAAWSLRRMDIVERPWDPTVGRLIRRAGAPVVPLFVEGSNSPAFQVAGLIHPMLRTLLLPREFVLRQHRPLRIRVGTPIPFEQLAPIEDTARLVAHLREVTLALGREA